MNPRLACDLKCAGCSRERSADPDRAWVYCGSDGRWRCPDCYGRSTLQVRVVEEPTVQSLGDAADWQRAQKTRSRPEGERMTLGDRARVR